MNLSIYLLSPRHLSPETIAVAFAKTSRSPESFREIAAELNDAESAKFHEKCVVGYGHASVAEHAVLHIAFENVSRLAIECIESNRLASYTEKSTRYKNGIRIAFIRPLVLPIRRITIFITMPARNFLKRIKSHSRLSRHGSRVGIPVTIVKAKRSTMVASDLNMWTTAAICCPRRR